MKNQWAAVKLPPAHLSFSKMKLCFIFEEDVLPESSSIAAGEGPIRSQGPHPARKGPSQGCACYPSLGRLRYPSQGHVRSVLRGDAPYSGKTSSSKMKQSFIFEKER